MPYFVFMIIYLDEIKLNKGEINQSSKNQDLNFVFIV